MPPINTGRSNVNQAGKSTGKRRVKRVRAKVAGPPAPPKPVTVAPADRVQERATKRTAQLKVSVRKTGDAPQDRAADLKKAQASVKKQYVASGGWSYKPGTTVPPKIAVKHAMDIRNGKLSKSQLAALPPVLKVLDQTTRPLHAIAGGVDAAVTGKNVPKAALRGLQNKDKTTFSTVLKHAGVKNKAVRSVAGFGLDVGLDPTTYLTLGTGPVVRKAAIKSGSAALAKDARKGVTVKLAGKEVPGVRRATAKVGEGGGKALEKAVPERARNAVRDAASEVNPNIAPSGVDKATHQASRRIARKARAATGQGDREAINLAHGIKSQIGPKNYAKVTDAIEAGDLTKLPKELQGHAATLRGHLAAVRQKQRAAGVKVAERKRYVPHKLTPKALKDDNKTAARVGGSGKPTPSSSKARKEKRTLAELRTAEPGRYRQDLHATVAERMAEGTASAAHATLAKDLADLGRAIPRGKKPVLTDQEAVYRLKNGKLTEVDTASKAFRKAPPAGKPLKAKFVVLNRKVYDRTMGTVQGPKGGTIMHGYDKTQSGFKRIALATPGFHIRNMVGDTAQAYLHQPGQKLPGNMVRAGRVLKAAGRIEKDQQKLGSGIKAGTGRLRTRHYGRVSYEEAAQKLIEAGAARSGYTSRELRDLATSGNKPLKRLPKSPAAVRRAFLNREDLPRLATAIHALRGGATYEEAAAKVAGAHFDYADLTPFERDIARRIMPFYTWTARNVPLQAKRLVTNPGKYAAFQKVRENAAQLSQPGEIDDQTKSLYKRLEAGGVKLPGGWEKYLTSYEQRNAGVPVSWKGHKFTVSAGLPLADLNELPGLSGPGEYLNKAASLVTPIVKDPVEFGFNYSFFFRDQIERDNSPLVPAPSPVGKWPAWAKKKFGVVKAEDKRSGKMLWQWPGKADYVAHAVPGLPATAVKMMTPGHDQQGKGPAQKALGIAGIKATPVDATTNAINMAYARLSEIAKRKSSLNQQGVGVKQGNVTGEYRRLLTQEKVLRQIAFQGKQQRGDAKLPSQGGPPRVRSAPGRVRVPGVAGRVRVPGGAGGRVKVP